MKQKVYKRVWACFLAVTLLVNPVISSGAEQNGGLESEQETTKQGYEYKEGDFVLFQDNVITNVYMDVDKEFPQVERAAQDLLKDMEAVTGKKPLLKQEKDGYDKNIIIVGTIGQGGSCRPTGLIW